MIIENIESTNSTIFNNLLLISGVSLLLVMFKNELPNTIAAANVALDVYAANPAKVVSTVNDHINCSYASSRITWLIMALNHSGARK